MGCQKKIVETIINNNADYVICLRNNQGKLYEQIEKHFIQVDELGKRIPPNRYKTYTTKIPDMEKQRKECMICITTVWFYVKDGKGSNRSYASNLIEKKMLQEKRLVKLVLYLPISTRDSKNSPCYKDTLVD